MKTAIACVFILSAALAAAQQGAGTFTVAGVGGATNGDQGRRDDQEGFRSGLAAALDYRSTSVGVALEFSPTTAGWLDVHATPGTSWRFTLQLDRDRHYSDDSVRPELTPAGTPVSTLYPFDNTLAVTFGDTTPVLTRNRWSARLAYLLDRGALELRARGVELDGERTPEAGGMTFGDFGAPAFFVPALESADSSEREVALGVRLDWLGLAWKGDVASANRSSSTTLHFPTYGRDRLLDVSAYREGHDADITSVSASVASLRPRLSWVGSARWVKVDGKPVFAGGIEGAPPTDTLAGGKSDATARVLAASLVLRPGGGWRLRVAGRQGEAEREAAGTEHLSGRSLPLAQRDDTDSWRAEGELSYDRGRLRTSVVGSRDRSEAEIRRERGAFQQLADVTTTTDAIRGELAVRIARAWRARAWGQRRTQEVEVELAELLSGYALADRERTIDTVGMGLSGRVGKLPLSVVAEDVRGTTDLDPPYFDPIYDPSWTLSPSRVRTAARSYLLHLAAEGGAAAVAWCELGWREQSWELVDTVTFPGYINGDEKVRGWTAAVGGEWTVAPSWRLSLSGWLEAPSEAVEHRAARAEASLERDLPRGFTARAGVQYRRFTESLYELDDYTLTALVVGVSGRF